jgi:hypothetical protein
MPTRRSPCGYGIPTVTSVALNPNKGHLRQSIEFVLGRRRRRDPRVPVSGGVYGPR